MIFDILRNGSGLRHSHSTQKGEFKANKIGTLYSVLFRIINTWWTKHVTCRLPSRNLQIYLSHMLLRVPSVSNVSLYLAGIQNVKSLYLCPIALFVNITWSRWKYIEVKVNLKIRTAQYEVIKVTLLCWGIDYVCTGGTCTVGRFYVAI